MVKNNLWAQSIMHESILKSYLIKLHSKLNYVKFNNKTYFFKKKSQFW